MSEKPTRETDEAQCVPEPANADEALQRAKSAMMWWHDRAMTAETDRDAAREALRELVDEIRQGVDPSDVNAKSGAWDRARAILDVKP